MTVRTIQFLAIVVTALALVPSGAHLAALPNKIGMTESGYFVAQGIYRGWAVLAALWVLAPAMNVLMAVMVRRQALPFWLAVLAAASFVPMFAVFFVWTFPANEATANWTSVPENWETLRRQWEYSHAANSAIALAALCLATASVLAWRPAAATGST